MILRCNCCFKKNIDNAVPANHCVSVDVIVLVIPVLHDRVVAGQLPLILSFSIELCFHFFKHGLHGSKLLVDFIEFSADFLKITGCALYDAERVKQIGNANARKRTYRATKSRAARPGKQGFS